MGPVGAGWIVDGWLGCQQCQKKGFCSLDTGKGDKQTAANYYLFGKHMHVKHDQILYATFTVINICTVNTY
jgi:hypothetical protein